MAKDSSAARRAFARGFASAFDIGLRVPPREAPLSSPDADATAIAKDWRRVGDALRDALAQVGELVEPDVKKPRS